MESASWQRPLYGFEISQNQAKMPLKSRFSDGLGGRYVWRGDAYEGGSRMTPTRPVLGVSSVLTMRSLSASANTLS